MIESDFENIENLLTKLLSLKKHGLSEIDMKEIYHYIDHGEYGLAFDGIICTYYSMGIKMNCETVAIIFELAKDMEINMDDAKPHFRLSFVK